MATPIDTMIVTNKGLKTVAKKVCNYSIFDPSKITKVGNPRCLANGTASGLSQTNYFTHSGLSFRYGKATITFEGTYVPNGNTSLLNCAYSLIDTNGNYSPIRVFCTNDSVRVYYGPSGVGQTDQQSIVRITGLTIKPQDRIQIILDFVNKDCTLKISVDNQGFQTAKGQIPVQQIELNTAYNSIQIGRDVYNSANFWGGNIYLNKFSIYSGFLYRYSPSKKAEITFTHILLSNGSIKLSDTSVPVAGKVCLIPVEIISQARNNILLRAYVPGDLYINIEKIGLYATIDGQQALFSDVPITLQKSKDLEYQLILNIFMDINIVNPYAYPEIILKNENYISMADLNIIRSTALNGLIDLERAIKMNAVQLGYDRSQIFYRLQKEIELDKENWMACDTLSKLTLNKYLGNIFNPPIEYYHIPYESFNFYRVRELMGTDAQLIVLNDEFYSSKDFIDFSNSDGFTLSMNILIPDYETDIPCILTKVNKSNNKKYFVVSYINKILSFELFFNNNSSEKLSINLSNIEGTNLINRPINFTVMKDNNESAPSYKAYINAQLQDQIDESNRTNFITIDPDGDYVLSNTLTVGADNPQTVIKDIMAFSTGFTGVEAAAVRKISQLLWVNS